MVIYSCGIGAGKIMHPVLEDVASMARGRFNIVKYKVDDEYDPFALKHKVRKFPHYLLVNRGEVMESFDGLYSKEQLLETLYRYAI